MLSMSAVLPWFWLVGGGASTWLAYVLLRSMHPLLSWVNGFVAVVLLLGWCGEPSSFKSSLASPLSY